MSISCGCMDMWLVFLTLILLTRFSQQGSLVSGGGQWADHVPHGCSRLIGISRRWGWARHLPGGCPDGGPWWNDLTNDLTHAPIPDLTLPKVFTYERREMPINLMLESNIIFLLDAEKDFKKNLLQA